MRRAQMTRHKKYVVDTKVLWAHASPPSPKMPAPRLTIWAKMDKSEAKRKRARARREARKRESTAAEEAAAGSDDEAAETDPKDYEGLSNEALTCAVTETIAASEEALEAGEVSTYTSLTKDVQRWIDLIDDRADKSTTVPAPPEAPPPMKLQPTAKRGVALSKAASIVDSQKTTSKAKPAATPEVASGSSLPDTAADQDLMVEVGSSVPAARWADQEDDPDWE